MNPINSTSSNRPYVLAALFAVAAAAAVPIDIPVARFAATAWTLGDVRKLLDISEAFAHGFGVLLILLTVAVLDPGNMRKLPRIVTCTFGAGLIAQVAKHLLPRIRPNVLFGLPGDLSERFYGFGAVAQADNLTGARSSRFHPGIRRRRLAWLLAWPGFTRAADGSLQCWLSWQRPSASNRRPTSSAIHWPPRRLPALSPDCVWMNAAWGGGSHDVKHAPPPNRLSRLTINVWRPAPAGRSISAARPNALSKGRPPGRLGAEVRFVQGRAGRTR